MVKIVKNTILNYVPEYFNLVNFVNPLRIFNVNDKTIKTGNIVYLCEREIRTKNNFAVQFAIEQSKIWSLPLKIIHPKLNFKHAKKQKFIDEQICLVQNGFSKLGIDFQIINKFPFEILDEIEIAMLIIDFNPILNRNYLKKYDFKIFEIDGHNIVPARFVSAKQEYNAMTFRRKIYYNIYSFLTESTNNIVEKVEADYVLDDFIHNKLQNYSKFKNNPSKNVLSGLSKYLNLGFISSQSVAIEVLKSGVSAQNKETFLEELIIRKELADNFCLHAKNFKNFANIPQWAKISLIGHENDLRTYVYSLDELEHAQTHDRLWNATQVQLINEGIIHGYLRMYWAKKLLEWSKTPEIALKNAIYLNDKYAFDSPSSNGYVGILWAIGGLHDRAFANYPVTGKIRRMTYESMKKKYDLSKYINRHEQL